jgi:4-diphosphocytidyl-2-C-methyl-D-erythritol kinase
MLTLRSPAKINLFLKLLNKREDGYHELASLFQSIDLCDTIRMSLSSYDSFTCDNLTLPVDSSNLVQKALALFRKKTGLEQSVNIQLTKKIPIEAGLGGGSSNAATTLWGLNELFDRPVTSEDLKSWSAELGSDISFFFSQGTAYCTGRGEIITSLQPLNAQKLWIVKPNLGLATKEVFRKVKLEDLPSSDPLKYLNDCVKGSLSCFNDLEVAAFSLMPELETLKKKLLSLGFPIVLMSGSGSSFFCIGDPLLPLELEISDHFVCRSSFISRSPGFWF